MSDEHAVIVTEGQGFEEQVFAFRVCGHSARSIAERFNISVAEVKSICLRLLPTYDRAARDEELALEIYRVNMLTMAWFPRAMALDAPAASIYGMLSERRGRLLGLDKMPERLGDAPLQIEQRPSSTDRIRAAIESLVAQGITPQLEVEGPTEPSPPASEGAVH